MRLGTVPQAVASGAAVILISACAAGVGIGAEPLEQAQAATPAQQSDNPPCGYDAHKRSVDVMSLGRTHGTVRVIEWSKRVRYDGTPQGIGSLVGKGKIKAGRHVTIKTSKRVQPSHVTVDIVKGKLTRNESHRKVWHCEPA